MTGKLLNVVYLICGSLFLLLNWSCNDFDSFGSEFQDDDWIHAKGIDTFRFSSTIANPDSVITFKNLTTLGSTNFREVSFPLGSMDDPMFGKVSAGFGSQLRIIPTRNTKFLYRPVDSIVLSLRFDTSLFYGKYQEPMSFGIYPLTEAYNPSSTYYSDHPLKYDPTKILGERNNFVASKTDSLTITEDTLQFKLYPQLRIQLDTAAFMSILRSYTDTVYQTLDSFSKVFNGIAILCNQGNGILSVLPEHSNSKITVYYKDSSIRQSKTEFNLGALAVKTPVYQINNSGTVAGQCIDGMISGDSLLCVQGFTGRDIRLDIPIDPNWNGKFINFAVLQFYVAELAGDNLSNYSPPGLLEIFDVSSGFRVAIDDVAFGLTSLSNYTRIFGGVPVLKDVNGIKLYQYRMNITRHFQKSLKANKPMELVISPLFKLETPARALFFGQGHSQYPAKLILTYSE